METKLINTREPDTEEQKKGAEIVFIRRDKRGNEYTIYGCKCNESWEQWGTWKLVLADYVEAIERWRFPNR